MKRLTTLLLLLSFLGDLHCQSDFSPNLKSFINWKAGLDQAKLSVKKVDKQSIHWTLADTEFLFHDYNDFFQQDTVPGYDTLLSRIDFASLKAQVLENIDSTTRWPRKFFEDLKLSDPRPKDELRKKDRYVAYSVPLFTEDGKFALLKHNYHCGILCARYRVSLFYRDLSGWRQVAVFYRAEA